MRTHALEFVPLAILLGGLIQSACAAPPPHRGDVEAIAARLEALTPWTQLGDEDPAKREQFVAALEEIARKDVDTIRRAVTEYLARARASPSGCGVDEWSRLFLLNRVVFRPPSDLPMARNRFFGGWSGVPVREGRDGEVVDALWPLSLEPAGRLRLVGRFGGYYGDDYDALGEFDHFRALRRGGAGGTGKADGQGR